MVGPATAGTPWKQCLGLLPALGKCCQHERAAVRSMAARGAAALASSHTMEVSARGLKGRLGWRLPLSGLQDSMEEVGVMGNGSDLAHALHP